MVGCLNRPEYDRVPRKTMLDTLKSLGCGYRMLRAIMATYKKTANILNSEIINSTIDVKQGAPMRLYLIYNIFGQVSENDENERK